MSSNQPSLVLERTPPQNIELEQALLGGIMCDPAVALPLVADIINPSVFYLEGHEAIYQAMLSLHARGIPPEGLSVVDELRARGELGRVGGSVYVMALLNQVATAGSVEQHARLIADKAVLRSCIRGCTQVIEECYRQELPVGDILDQWYTTAVELATAGSSAESVQASDALRRYFSMDRGRGLSSGFPVLDGLTRGFKPGQFWVIGAATKMGKTALAMQIASHLAICEGVPVCFVNLEMDQLEIAERLLCQQTLTTSGGRAIGVCSYRLDAGDLNPQERVLIDQSAQRIACAPLYLRTMRKPSIGQLRGALRWELRHHGVKLAVVDYLGLLRADNTLMPRYEQVSQISRDVKLLAGELGIPLVVPHQLSRAVMARKDFRPQLSDLRDSGSIEQDADGVIFCYRPSYYGVPEPQWSKHAGVKWTKRDAFMPCAEIIVAANRHGESGIVPAYWYGAITRYLDADQEAQSRAKEKNRRSREVHSG